MRWLTVRRAVRSRLFYLTKLVIYIDRDDWWIGYYRGPNNHYVCLLPTIVVRWRRGRA
jgi:hypothetical protein